MTRRELGAGVSVMWVIFLIVLLLGAGAYIYFVQSDMERMRNQVQTAQANLAEAEKATEDERRSHVGLSGKVGFAAAGGTSNSDSLQQRIDDLKSRFPSDIGSGDNTVELVLERLVSIADRNDQERQAADSQFQTELAARQAAEDAKGEVERTMQGQLDSVNSELRDARDAANAAQSSADDRYSQLQDEYDQKDTDMREASATHEQQLANANAETEKMKARTVSLAQKVEILGVDDDPWAADGSVIDAGGGNVFINIGSKDLLRHGVRFEVYDFDKGYNRVSKGQIEVRELENNFAVARIIQQHSSLDPIGAGDKISNPHFNRNRTKNFVLVGNFPAYGKSFLTQRLESLGATVSDSVNSDVDAIILGSKAPEEDAPELTELDEYKLAQELSIQVMRLADLEPFVRP